MTYIKRRSCDAVHIYNPEGWEPKQCLPRSLHRHEDAARYLVHRIHMGRIIDRSNRDDPVPLKAAYLREVITDPDVYMNVKNALLASNTVVTDNQYVVGRKCKAFKLSRNFDGVKHVKTTVKDPDIARRIMALRQRSAILPLPDTYDYLRLWLRRIEIDRENALSHILFNRQFSGHCDGRHETSVEMIDDKIWFTIFANKADCIPILQTLKPLAVNSSNSTANPSSTWTSGIHTH